MPHYMFQARYTAAAVRAMVADPHDREPAARKLIEAAGGKLNSMFFCFGAEDIVAIVEAPDDSVVAACSLAIGASGAFSSGATTKLMTSKEAMKAMALAKAAMPSYAPPVAG